MPGCTYNAMRHAGKLLAQMNLTVSGAIDRASLIGSGDEVGLANFEPNFYSGWAYEHATRAHNKGDNRHQCVLEGWC